VLVNIESPLPTRFGQKGKMLPATTGIKELVFPNRDDIIS